MAGNGTGVNDKRRTGRGRNKEKETDVTICPMCNNKMEDPMICQNKIVLCPHCNEILLLSENSQRKILSPISQEISSCTSPKHVPEVCTNRQQYDLALKDPHYFHIMLELVSLIKNKPFRIPVMCRGKELNLHRMFAEVTCRGGLLKVYQERRLREVCAALAENLIDWDLYNIYVTILNDLEAWLCNFPTAPPLREGPMNNNKVLVPSSREGQPQPQWIQASTPYTNAAAPVNNNQQWISLPAGFNIGSTGHLNRLSSGPCPMPGIIRKGGQPYPTGLTQGFKGQPSEWIDTSTRLANSVPMKNNQQYSSLPADFNIGSTGHSNRLSSGPYPMPGVILKGGQQSEWIDASTRFANSSPLKNNQQLCSLQQAGVNFGSTYHPNGLSLHLSSAVANGNQMCVSASDNKFHLGLDSKGCTSSSLPAPHRTQGMMGGQASEQGIHDHDPFHNQRY